MEVDKKKKGEENDIDTLMNKASQRGLLLRDLTATYNTRAAVMDGMIGVGIGRRFEG